MEAKSTKYCYGVVAIVTKVDAATPFGTQTLPFSSLADGCKGVMMVFHTREAAEKWSNGRNDIITLEEKNIDD